MTKVDKVVVTRPNDDGRCPAMLLDEYTSMLDQCVLSADHDGACSLVAAVGVATVTPVMVLGLKLFPKE